METQANHEPSRDEIRAECAEIRKGWTEREHWIRAGYSDGKPRMPGLQRLPKIQKRVGVRGG